MFSQKHLLFSEAFDNEDAVGSRKENKRMSSHRYFLYPSSVSVGCVYFDKFIHSTYTKDKVKIIHLLPLDYVLIIITLA